MADSYDVEIEFLNASGDGVARIGRRQIVVSYTIPGERVRVRVGAPRGADSIGMPETIVRPSPHRVEPGCRHFGIEAMPGVGPCGGCSWQHIAYPEQLRLKAAAPDGALKSLAIRVSCASPEIMGTLVVAHDADRTVRVATRRVLDGPEAPTSFHVNVHPKADAFILGPRTRRVSGHERLREGVAGVSFLISPNAFFQTNIRAAEILARLVAEALPAGVRVLDLYAGAGLFALPLARGGHDVVAVEENRSAVADGEASRRLSDIPRNGAGSSQRAEHALRDAAMRPHAVERFDAVVLDPPREGCSPAVIDLVFNALAPATAVYISSNPEALARDLAAIVCLPYRIQSLQPVDMFPHTAHVETVAVLTRA